jgi:hypothetical protein
MQRRELPESAWQKDTLPGSFDSLSLLTSLALAQDDRFKRSGLRVGLWIEHA